MKLVIEISDELLSKILSYGDIKLTELSVEQLREIKETAEFSILSRIEDEPHYAFDDFVGKIV